LRNEVVLGRPFVKRFALYAIRPLSVSCTVLSVTLVYCGQTIGWMKMKLGVQVGLGPGHIVLDGTQLPSSEKGHSPQFSAHVCRGQTAGWIKMPLGTKVGIGPCLDPLNRLATVHERYRQTGQTDRWTTV